MRLAARQEITRLRKDLKEHSQKAVFEVLKTADVVFATCTGASDVRKRIDRMLKRGECCNGKKLTDFFDVVLIDEAAQTIEAACWIPMLTGKRTVLAGDHNQLSATVKSDEGKRYGLDRTLFARCVEYFGDEVSTLLEVQYRMNESIMGWSSAEFYGGRLQAAESVAQRLCRNIDNACHKLSDDAGNPAFRNPLVFVDTGGKESFRELADDSSDSGKRPNKLTAGSKCNPGEAGLLLFYLKLLIKCGLVADANASDKASEKHSLCVITPYNRQVEHLRLLLQREFGDQWKTYFPVNTVDSFQGREADIVLISLVRSNDRAEVGFLSDFRRLNVAVTRARLHCCIFGDGPTICGDQVLASLYGYCLDNAKVLNVGFQDRTSFDSDDALSQAALHNLSNPFAGDNEDLKEIDGLMNDDNDGFSVPQVKRAKESREDASGVLLKSGAPTAPTHLSEDQVQQRRQKFLKRIHEAGLLGGTIAQGKALCSIKQFQGFLDFSNSLNARERLIVHEICEELGLKHESQGEGRKRFVRVLMSGTDTLAQVKQMLADTNVEDDAASSKLEASSEVDVSSGMEFQSASSKEATVGKQEAASSSAGQYAGQNSMLKDAAAARAKREEERKREHERRQAELKQQKQAREADERHKKLEEKKARKKNQKAKGGKEVNEEEDFEALMAEFDESKTAGNCKVCKVSVKHMMGMMTRCSFCSYEFCTKHIQAEVHGCGDAARVQARQEWRDGKGMKHLTGKAGKIVNGEIVKPVSGNTSGNAKAKLDERLKEKASERKGKKAS